MEFENDEIDMHESEKQRYKAIKKTGNYMEVNILIGAENEDVGDGLIAKTPIVSTEICNCGAQEIGCAYMSLIELAKTLEKKYPSACFAAKLAMSVENMGSSEHITVIRNDEED